MGIYLHNMEMPTLGYREIRIYPDGRVTEEDECGIDEVVGVAEPIPPHGRLGDMDELHKEAVRRSEKAGTYDSWYNCTDRVISAFDIERAKTIIPAEEE